MKSMKSFKEKWSTMASWQKAYLFAIVMSLMVAVIILQVQIPSIFHLSFFQSFLVVMAILAFIGLCIFLYSKWDRSPINYHSIAYWFEMLSREYQTVKKGEKHYQRFKEDLLALITDDSKDPLNTKRAKRKIRDMVQDEAFMRIVFDGKEVMSPTQILEKWDKYDGDITNSNEVVAPEEIEAWRARSFPKFISSVSITDQKKVIELLDRLVDEKGFGNNPGVEEYAYIAVLVKAQIIEAPSFESLQSTYPGYTAGKRKNFRDLLGDNCSGQLYHKTIKKAHSDKMTKAINFFSGIIPSNLLDGIMIED